MSWLSSFPFQDGLGGCSLSLLLFVGCGLCLVVASVVVVVCSSCG